jgi:hypothetical protein
MPGVDERRPRGCDHSAGPRAEPDDEEPGDEPPTSEEVRCLLEANHRAWLARIVALLVGKGHSPDVAFDGFQAACVEFWHHPELFDPARLGGGSAEARLFQLLAGRASWRAIDEERRRGQSTRLEHDAAAGDGGVRLEPDPHEATLLPDDAYWMAMNSVTYRHPSVCPSTIRRCLEGEPLRAVAREDGTSPATLCRQVQLFKGYYRVLGRPESPSFDVWEVARLRREGALLVVVLEGESRSDNGLCRRSPCMEGDRIEAWICEVVPPRPREREDG